jgi:TM2 domain-containing membrane protein YozV
MAEQTTSIQVNLTGKNVVVAYLLWWFLGWAGVHRLYLGRVKTGLAQLILFAIGVVTAILLIGYIFLAIWGVWWLLDAFLPTRSSLKRIQSWVSCLPRCPYRSLAGVITTWISLRSSMPSTRRAF